ncbi:hypothetical protein [Diaphorobacter nitroreducens]|uniref:hypothetical protein n=1 Tax=Diaphorobacter nitroreducens TaxID=164759 RepID=UPI0028A0963B|nr:hypothetical protein [Diaphorobacter nitroreducens]
MDTNTEHYIISIFRVLLDKLSALIVVLGYTPQAFNFIPKLFCFIVLMPKRLDDAANRIFHFFQVIGKSHGNV